MIDWFSLVFGLIAILPFVLLTRQYFLTKLNDYLYFGISFLTFALTGILPLLTQISNKTEYSNEFSESWYLVNVGFSFLLTFTSWYFMYLIGYRSNHYKERTIFLYVMTGIYVACTASLFLLRIKSIPDTSSFIGFSVHYLGDDISVGAFYQWNDMLSLGVGYPLLFLIFKLICAISFLFAMAKMENVANYSEFNRGKLLWIFCMIGYIFAQIILLLEIFAISSSLSVLYNIFRLISSLIFFYIAIIMPEGFLLSRVQLLRAFETYDEEKSILDGKRQGFLYDKTVEYLSYIQQKFKID